MPGSNVRWLARYRHPRCASRAGVTRRLQEAFAGPAPLLAGAAQAGDPLATSPLFRMMWRQELVADVTRERLGPATGPDRWHGKVITGERGKPPAAAGGWPLVTGSGWPTRCRP